MNQDHIKYLAKLHQGQWFGFEGEQTHENMWVKGHEKPSITDIEQGTKLMIDKEKLEINQSKRRNAYQKESDPLFLKWQRGEATKQEWLDKIEEIKERFPKPEK